LEVVLKSANCKVDIGDSHGCWSVALEAMGATPLVLWPEHVKCVHDLAFENPFDRMLSGQAMCEELELVTTDRDIPRSASRVRVLS
jgi:PIN domain nuclease of toxin-antitoxin system